MNRRTGELPLRWLGNGTQLDVTYQLDHGMKGTEDAQQSNVYTIEMVVYSSLLSTANVGKSMMLQAQASTWPQVKVHPSLMPRGGSSSFTSLTQHFICRHAVAPSQCLTCDPSLSTLGHRCPSIRTYQHYNIAEQHYQAIVFFE